MEEGEAEAIPVALKRKEATLCVKSSGEETSLVIPALINLITTPDNAAHTPHISLSPPSNSKYHREAKHFLRVCLTARGFLQNPPSERLFFFFKLVSKNCDFKDCSQKKNMAFRVQKPSLHIVHALYISIFTKYINKAKTLSQLLNAGATESAAGRSEASLEECSISTATEYESLRWRGWSCQLLLYTRHAWCKTM